MRSVLPETASKEPNSKILPSPGGLELHQPRLFLLPAPEYQAFSRL